MKIVNATLEHIPLIAPLFNAYRMFYKQNSDESAATNFIQERLRNNESIVLLALENEKPAGFVQLYKSFSSVSLKPVYILNDLFVASDRRGKGIGESLLKAAKELCISDGFKGLALETAIDNPAQHLYEKLDWKKDTECFHYFWTASTNPKR